jgi:hypothetical protein
MGGCDVSEAEGAESKEEHRRGAVAGLFEKLKARGGFAGEDRAELFVLD